MDWHTWWLFLVAVTGLALAPGPNGLLALSHGALYGHRTAVATVLGGISGFALIVAVSVLGLGSLLQAEPRLLMGLKFVGAFYLAWLGWQLWRAPAPDWYRATQAESTRPLALFRTGALTALANPKVLLFFGAFIPPFINPNAPLLTQLVVMTLTFCAVEFAVEYGLARLAHQLRPLLAGWGHRFNRGCAAVFVLIAVGIPLS
ncbi:LysE family translocator [Ferrimonas balearica]|uniref:LysE family translocator n=1 Tax=Ferrimonas balearica TaxID=44012 RepID=UPI001C5952A8|nr:LysE family translocator [Ferrimonas balearica]MBW3165850.1 LysE family translocator [Ferrimonas balearica]